jgi:hypothetical protein
MAYSKNIQKYLLRKSYRALGKALQKVDLFPGAESVYMDLGNSGIKVDLKLMETRLKDILLKICDRESKK